MGDSTGREGIFSLLSIPFVAAINAAANGLRQAPAAGLFSRAPSAVNTEAAARRAARKARKRRRAWLEMMRRQAVHGWARDATEAEAVAMLAGRGGGRPNPLDERIW
ncbi:hypothetical protein [Acidisphaera sp. S103]|uniref:hypothetical protein n=1 Tax=Acidisphaera sp. S103 TaxID=1747223 RepID=UPI00131D6F5C|nr:hypothetical protein [Acidisphaera sp. S103]